MKITNLWEGLKRIANGDYVLEGDLVSDEDIVVELDDRLVVRGKVESKKRILVRCSIKAGWGIKAGDGIEAGWGIKAGDGIEAKTFISAQLRIFAGTSVCHSSTSCKKFIKCAELRNGEIAFGDLVIADAP